jgi:hypothetical protein
MDEKINRRTLRAQKITFHGKPFPLRGAPLPIFANMILLISYMQIFLFPCPNDTEFDLSKW